jgi:ABC-2 type transport system ATP-binding protein
MLTFDGATKRFGGLVALDGCSFVARPGRLTGFLGPNGAGKTTAMRAVFGLVALDAGSVRWRGVPVGPRVRARFGYMPEERGLYPGCGSATSSCTWGGCPAARGGTPGARSTPGSTASAWRPGAGTGSTPCPTATSSGVQLVAALVNEPDLLVLDEPFAGLDPLAMVSMSALLAEVAAAGATVLFSSHQLDLVEDICEDVVIIDAGRIVRAGDLAELRAALPQRFVAVRYRGPAPDWSTLPGVELIQRDAGRARLRVDRGVDLAALVTLAGRTAEVISFAYEPPRLPELFREAVAA